METLSHLRPRRCEGVRNDTFSPRSVPTRGRRVAGIAWNDDAFRFKSGRGSGKWVNDPALARRPRTAVGVTVPLPSSITYITSHQTSHHITVNPDPVSWRGTGGSPTGHFALSYTSFIHFRASTKLFHYICFILQLLHKLRDTAFSLFF